MRAARRAEWNNSELNLCISHLIRQQHRGIVLILTYAVKTGSPFVEVLFSKSKQDAQWRT